MTAQPGPPQASTCYARVPAPEASAPAAEATHMRQQAERMAPRDPLLASQAETLSTAVL